MKYYVLRLLPPPPPLMSIPPTPGEGTVAK